MRLILVASLVVAVLVAPASADAHAGCREKKGGSVQCDIRDSSPPASDVGRAPPTTVSVDDIIYWPKIVFRDEVGFCIIVEREVFPNAAASSRGHEAEMRTLNMIGDYDMCPGVARPPRTRASVARDVIEEFLPAPPQPHIAPGYAITGKTAYLETRGNLHPPADTRPTPLGDITVTFTGTYRIDWGDGTTTTHDTEGLAWPDGTLTHVYTHTGLYDVVVTIDWTAHWRIATTTGTITDGLHSTSHINDFDVRQLQAVRNQ